MDIDIDETDVTNLEKMEVDVPGVLKTRGIWYEEMEKLVLDFDNMEINDGSSEMENDEWIGYIGCRREKSEISVRTKELEITQWIGYIGWGRDTD